MTTALLLIDIQNDYFPGGKNEVPTSLIAAQHANALLTKAREKRIPVFHVQHISTRPGSTFFLPDTEGARIHPLVTPLPHETVVVKQSPNSFRGTDLEEKLRSAGVTKLVIAGMMTQMCIDAGTRAAFDLGFACNVAHDACAARPLTFNGKTIAAEEVHTAFLAALGAVYARVLSTDDLLHELDQE